MRWETHLPMRKQTLRAVANPTGDLSSSKRTSRYLFVGLLQLYLLWAGARSEGFEDYVEQLPEIRFRLEQQVQQWQDVPQVGAFSSELLSELILRKFSRWNLSPASPSELWSDGSLEVYELLDSQGAYGAFTAVLSTLAGATSVQWLDLPVDVVAADDRLAFWRGHFFFQLRISSAGLQERAAVAERIISVINEANLYPFTVNQLPPDGLIRESIRFYLGSQSLSGNRFFPSPVLPLVGFDHDIEVAFARYEPEGNGLFILGYPTTGLALRYFDRIQSELNSLRSPLGAYGKRSGPLICLFIGPEEESRRILSQVEYKAQVQWIYERQPTAEEIQEKRNDLVSFFGIVAASILFSGLGMVCLAGLGIMIGVGWYVLRKRFPAFSRHGEMTRLDLSDRKNK